MAEHATVFSTEHTTQWSCLGNSFNASLSSPLNHQPFGLLGQATDRQPFAFFFEVSIACNDSNVFCCEYTENDFCPCSFSTKIQYHLAPFASTIHVHSTTVVSHTVITHGFAVCDCSIYCMENAILQWQLTSVGFHECPHRRCSSPLYAVSSNTPLEEATAPGFFFPEASSKRGASQQRPD